MWNRAMGFLFFMHCPLPFNDFEDSTCMSAKTRRTGRALRIVSEMRGLEDKGCFRERVLRMD